MSEKDKITESLNGNSLLSSFLELNTMQKSSLMMKYSIYLRTYWLGKMDILIQHIEEGGASLRKAKLYNSAQANMPFG